mgnify:CR=1 FL=1
MYVKSQLFTVKQNVYRFKDYSFERKPESGGCELVGDPGVHGRVVVLAVAGAPRQQTEHAHELFAFRSKRIFFLVIKGPVLHGGSQRNRLQFRNTFYFHFLNFFRSL